MNLNQSPSNDDKTMWDIWVSPYQLAAISVADEIGLFGKIKGNKLSIEEIADLSGINRRGAKSLCGVLVALNMLEKDLDKFSLTSKAMTYLVPDSPFYWGHVFATNCSRYPHSELLKALRDGQNSTSLVKDWEESSITPEIARKFTNAMHTIILMPTIAAMKTDIFNSVSRFLDVGGGPGCFAIMFVKTYSNREAGVFDLPVVCEITKEYLSKYGVTDNVRIYGGNFFKNPLPKGYDGIFFSNIFHDWPPEQCKQLAVSAYQALEPGGQIFLHEMLFDDNEKTDPLTIACMDLSIFMKLSAQQFSRQELQNILTYAGFDDVKFTKTFGYYSVISAKKQ